jgi:peptidyl-prolyl cis-trans isomerase C
MKKAPLFFSLILALLAMPAPAFQPLVSGKDGLSLTAEEVIADLNERKVPKDTQERVLSNPDNLRRLTVNLYVRRVLAERARKQGIDKEPEVAKMLTMASERLLSEMLLGRSVGAPPDDAALEQLARNEYNASAEKFKIPEEIRVRHILIERKRPEVVKVAKDVLAKLKDGADFEKMAAEYSDDPGSKAKGGDLGFFPRGRMERPFDEAAFALAKPGDMSGLVETKFGLHILRLEDRRPASQRPFAEVKDELVRTVATRVLNDRRTAIVNAVEVPMNNEAIDAFIASRPSATKPAVAPAPTPASK